MLALSQAHYYLYVHYARVLLGPPKIKFFEKLLYGTCVYFLKDYCVKRFRLEFQKNSTSKVTTIILYASDKDNAKYEATKYMDRIMRGNIIWIKVEEVK